MIQSRTRPWYGPSQTLLSHWKLTTMPPHHCCTFYTCKSPSSASITLHYQSCSKYKAHLMTVFKLINRSVARARANDIDSTRGLMQTPGPYSQQRSGVWESRMEIDNTVSLHIFTGWSEQSDPHLNSCIHLELTLRKHLYHLRFQPLPAHPSRHLLCIPYSRWLCHHHLQCYCNQDVHCTSIVCQPGIRTSILNLHIPYLPL